ncbi:MAG: glycosyltransferase, partial [Bdellovibrionales bacterium]
SLYEGFGFPVLEAMRLGCPVITSNVSATPEVADNAALLVNPHNAEDLAHAMERIASDQKLRQDLIELGRVRGQHFSWAKCAKETAAIYEWAVQNK